MTGIQRQNSPIVLKVKVSNCVVDVPDARLDWTIANVIEHVQDILMQDYQPFLSSCNILSVFYHSRKLQLDSLLSRIAKSSDQVTLFVRNYIITLVLAKPLPIKFIMEKSIIVASCLLLDCSDTATAHICVRDMVVRGMLVSAVDGVTDTLSIRQLLQNQSKKNFILELNLNNEVMGIERYHGEDNPHSGVLEVEIGRVVGLADREREQMYCTLSLDGQKHTESTESFRVKNGSLLMQSIFSIPISHTADEMLVELFANSRLRTSRLVCSCVIDLQGGLHNADRCIHGEFDMLGVAGAIGVRLFLRARLHQRTLLDVYDGFAQCPSDLLFHQLVNFSGADSLDLLTDSPDVVRSLSLTSSVFTGALIYPRPSVAAPSPCVFMLSPSTDIASRSATPPSHSAYQRNTLHSLSSHTGSQVSATLKKLYRPEQVTNSLSASLHAEQLLAAHSPAAEAMLQAGGWPPTPNEFTIRVNIKNNLGEFLEFVVPTEEAYWDWCEALGYAFVCVSRPWTGESLTYVDDLKSSMVFCMYKRGKSGYSHGDTREKRRPVLVSLAVTKGILRVLKPDMTQCDSGDVVAVVCAADVAGLQFSHSWSGSGLTDQIRVDVVGGIFGESACRGSLRQQAFVIKVSTDNGQTLCSHPVVPQFGAVYWQSALLFSSANVGPVRSRTPPAYISFQLCVLPTSSGRTTRSGLVSSSYTTYDTEESTSEKSVDVATLLPVSDVSVIPVASPSDSEAHRVSSDVSAGGIPSDIGLVRPSKRQQVSLLTGLTGAGMKISRMVLEGGRELVGEARRGMYVVMYLAKGSRLVKDSKQRTETTTILPAQWNSDHIFPGASYEEHDFILIRLKCRGAFRSPVLGEYSLFIPQFSRIPSSVVLSDQSNRNVDVPRLRITAAVISSDSHQFAPSAQSDVCFDPARAVKLIVDVNSGSLQQPSCAWPCRVFLPSPCTGVSETETCHFKVDSQGLYLICDYCEEPVSCVQSAEDFMRHFTTPNPTRSGDAKGRNRADIGLAQVIEYQYISEGGNDIEGGFINKAFRRRLLIVSLEDVELPMNCEWDGKWWVDKFPGSVGDTEEWVFGSDLWCIAEGITTSLGNGARHVKARLWKRHIFLRSRVTTMDTNTGNSLQLDPSPVGRVTDRKISHSPSEPIANQPTPSAITREGVRPLKTCLPFVDGCVAVSFEAVLTAVVICPTVVKCLVLCDVLTARGEVVRLAVKIVVGSCPAMKLCALIQDRCTTQRLHAKIGAIHKHSLVDERKMLVLDVVHHIVHSLSVLDVFADECSPFVRRDILKKKRGLVGLLKGMQRRYAPLFSHVFDLSSSGCLDVTISMGDAEVETETVQGVITRVRHICLRLSEALRQCVTSQPEGLDADTREHVKGVLRKIINVHFDGIVSAVATVASTRRGMLRLKGQREKLQLLYFVMKEDDVVDRILRRYLPLLGLEAHPPALLTTVLHLDKLFGRFANVMEDELKMWCERVLRHHLAEGEVKRSTATEKTTHMLWAISEQDTRVYRRCVSGRVEDSSGFFSSSVPEDLVSTIRHFIDFVMSDSCGADENFSSVLSGPSDRLRRGTDSTAMGATSSSQHSMLRVSQFQSCVLGAVASTLVWVRDVLASLIRAHTVASGGDPVVSTQFDCSMVNDSIRMIALHIPSLEMDFTTVLSDAAQSGISMSVAYRAFLETLVNAVGRIVPGIFEDAMEALRPRSSGPSWSLKDLWLRGSGADCPFAVICEIGEIALSCLQRWMDPVGFEILLGNIIADMCMLLLCILRELAAERFRMISCNEEGRCTFDGAQVVAKYSSDLKRIENLYLRFEDSERCSKAVDFASRSVYLHFVAARAHVQALRDYESLLTAEIPSMDTSYTTASAGTQDDPEPSPMPASSQPEGTGSLMNALIAVLEDHNTCQASVTSAVKTVILLRVGLRRDMMSMWGLCVNNFCDHPAQSRYVCTREDLFRRVFSVIPKEFCPFGEADPVQPFSALDKTVLRLRQAMSASDSGDDSSGANQRGALGKMQSTFAVSSAVSYQPAKSIMMESCRREIEMPTDFPDRRLPVLQVKVIEAKDLKNTEYVGKSSPYVTAQLIRGGGHFRDTGVPALREAGTSVFSESLILKTPNVPNSLNPTFNHVLQFDAIDLVGLQVELKVFSWSRYWNPALIAVKIVNISGLTSSKSEDLWLELDPPHSSHSCEVAIHKPITSKGSDTKSYGLLHVEISLINYC